MRWIKGLVLSLSFIGALYGAFPSFLEPEDAFKADMHISGDTVSVKVTLGDAIYLYRDKVKLVSDTPNVKLDYKLPKGESHEGLDGPEFVFFHELSFDAKVSGVAAGTPVSITLKYQGCSEQGLCYQPMELKKSFTVDTASTNQAKASASAAADTQGATQQDEVVQDEYAEIFQGSVIAVVFAFFGFGVLLSLTPCVFPMIPILSSIIVSQGEGITTKKAFWLSMVYVLAMAIAYTIAGVLAGLFGSNLQAALQTPWVIILFSLTFVLLAFSMFGFYELEMPKWIQTRLTRTSHEAEGKGVWGVAIMGFLSALIVGPCVAAPLAGALVYIGESGDAVLGGLALFAMSLGMGLPLLAVGVGAGKFMPKPGGWMEAVKAVFGVVMLIVAIWMLDRIVSETATMMLLSVLLIISSVYMGTFDKFEEAVSGWRRFWKGAGIAVFLYGAMLFVGGLTNGTILDPLRSFTQVAVSEQTTRQGLEFTKSANSIEDLNKIVEEGEDRIVMLDFTASWCVSCKEMEEVTFKNQAVKDALKEFILVKVDITKSTDANQALAKKFQVVGPPSIRFVRPCGKEGTRARINGFVEPEAFLEKLKKVI